MKVKIRCRLDSVCSVFNFELAWVDEMQKVPKTRIVEWQYIIYKFLIDNIFVQFGGRVFQQTIGIPMGTNCAPLLADLCLDFIGGLLKRKQKQLALNL